MSALRIRNVWKRYGMLPVLKGIDLDIENGEFTILVGPSGCGKSTLLNIIAGLDTASQGSIEIGGRAMGGVAAKDRNIAMVFQSYALYPSMTVRQNMTFGMECRRVPKREQNEAVDRVARLLQIEALLNRKPSQLSGGQRQRVAMGRALVRDPLLFLFDEPLSNLDAKLRVQMRAEIRRLQRRLGVTSLYVTHDQTEAMTLGDRLLVLHEGRPAQLATPIEVFERPADTYVASFIGAPAMNFLPGTLIAGGAAVHLDAGPTIPLPTCIGSGQYLVTVGIRPEHITVHPAAATTAEALTLHVDLIEPLGSESLIHGRLSKDLGQEMVVRVPGYAPQGDTLALSPAPEHVHIFDRVTGRLLPRGIG
jgi:sn-glycerol 3-phosphate transport system ATP-binding protein